jgi:hypothetical protein
MNKKILTAIFTFSFTLLSFILIYPATGFSAEVASEVNTADIQQLQDEAMKLREEATALRDEVTILRDNRRINKAMELENKAMELEVRAMELEGEARDALFKAEELL